jgi:hypothetical protein
MQDQPDLRARLEEALAEGQRLREEVRQLRAILAGHSITKQGSWAYRPAGKKNWLAILASLPEKHKKVDRQTRTLYAVTDDVIRQHLTGKKTVGVYPLLIDETCRFLVADFDKIIWQEDSLACLATCQRAGVPAYLERSRPGNGGHVWMFFESPVTAVLARKMGCALLTQSMERRHHLGLDSYDRFFPNQDRAKSPPQPTLKIIASERSC